MSEVLMRAEVGRVQGSRASNRLRGEGKIPGVVYGHGSDPVSVAVPRRELRAALTTDAGMNALINLEVDGTTHLTIVKDLQRDPVRSAVTHVDFIIVSRDEVVTVEVPIVLEGEAEQVVKNDGTLEQQLFSLTVSATPGSIPNDIVVDVSAMAIGDSVRVGDLAMPPGVSTEVDPEEPVVLAQVSQAALEAEALDAEAAEAEAAEGDESGEAAEDGSEGQDE